MEITVMMHLNCWGVSLGWGHCSAGHPLVEVQLACFFIRVEWVR